MLEDKGLESNNYCSFYKIKNPYSKVEQGKRLCMVGPSGLEPPTSRLSGVRSNQLSYGPL